MGRFNLLLLATVAIGIFALPMVISTFSGSHEFVAGENVECTKCHADVETELAASASNHTHANDDWSGGTSGLTVFECVECHNVSGIDGIVGGGGHAAQKVDCAYCHNQTFFEESGGDYRAWAHGSPLFTGGIQAKYGMTCTSCHYGTSFNAADVFIDDVFNEITLETAAHKGFYDNAVNDTLLLGATEACIGCHTHVEVNFTEPLGGGSMRYNPATGEFALE